MGLTCYLSVGDGATSDYLDLNQTGAYFVRALRMPPADEGDPRRVVELDLDVEGSTADQLWERVQAVHTKLAQARTASGAYGVGLGVSLGVQPETSTMVYFDVLDGTVSTPAWSATATVVTLTLALHCLPFARGAAYTTTVTATLTNGDGASTLVEDIPGDVPALVRMRFTDVSTNSVRINRLRIGTFSLPSLSSSDVDPIRDASAVSPGSSSAESDTVGGSRARVTLSDTWQYVAGITNATPTNRNSGLFDVWARVRSSSAILATPEPTSNGTLSGSGSLPSGTYQFRLVAIDGSGNWSAASSIVTRGVSAGQQFSLPHVAVAGATNIRIYWKRDTQPWRYKLDGNATSPAVLTSETGATTEDPPDAASGGMTSVRAVIGLSSATTLYAQPDAETSVNGSAWELVHLGTVPLPPLPPQDGGTTEGWVVRVQARQANGTAPTFDVDALWLYRHPDGHNACQVTVEYTGLNLATQRRWMVETRRDGRTFAWLTSSGSTTEAGQLDVQGGPLYVGPGDCLVWWHADKAGGVSDVTDLKATLLLTITPRYRIVRGS